MISGPFLHAKLGKHLLHAQISLQSSLRQPYLGFGFFPLVRLSEYSPSQAAIIPGTLVLLFS
jgi:hypothetical protein